MAEEQDYEFYYYVNNILCFFSLASLIIACMNGHYLMQIISIFGISIGLIGLIGLLNLSLSNKMYSINKKMYDPVYHKSSRIAKIYG